MTWARIVEPANLYPERDRVARLFEPSEDFDPRLGAGGASRSVLSLVSARDSIWAAMCLATGYASQRDDDTGLVMVELASTAPQIWSDTDLTSYCTRYNNLGYPPDALVRSARVITTGIPLALITAAGIDAGTLETCIAMHRGNPDAIMKCLEELQLASVQSRSSETISPAGAQRPQPA